MSTHPRSVLDLREIVHALEQATGIRSGFPSASDYTRLHHVIELDGLCRDNLGHDRFCAAYCAARGEAVRIARREFIVEPIRDGRRVVTGYEFGFGDAATAMAFRGAVLAAKLARGVV